MSLAYSFSNVCFVLLKKNKNAWRINWIMVGRDFQKCNLFGADSTQGGGRQASSLTAAEGVLTGEVCWLVGLVWAADCHVDEGYGIQSLLSCRAKTGGRTGNFSQALCFVRAPVCYFTACCNAAQTGSVSLSSVWLLRVLLYHCMQVF